MATPMTLVQDNFNSYTNGSIVGQGDWESYVNGYNFVVQDAVVFEGAKAIYNNSSLDCVIGKQGTLQTDGTQSVWVRTENRNNYSYWIDGNVMVQVSKYLWGSPGGGLIQSFITVSFKKDGNVAFYNYFANVYQNFATYNDNEWTLLEMEWRSSDLTARYRVNCGTWTNWEPVPYSSYFVGYDYVGFGFQYGGSGGVYFDKLGFDEFTNTDLSTWGSIKAMYK